MTDTVKKIYIYILLVVAGLTIGGLIYGAAVPKEAEVVEKMVEVEKDTGDALELSEGQIPALIEAEDGEITEVILPTLEEVDGGEVPDEIVPTTILDDLDKAGRGELIDTSSWQSFRDAVIGKCWSLNNPYGSQCVNLATIFWLNYGATTFTTCGTGAARGAWDCKEKIAGNDFVLIENPAELQAGDWIITNGGTWGHVFMAVGPYNNGYVAGLGTNQGGTSCEQGGAAANIVNLSLKTFRGAFRPKSYIIPVPTPVSEPVPAAPDTGSVR